MDPALVCTVGDLVEDVVVRLSGLPAIGEDTPSAISRRRGVSAASVAVAVVRADGRARLAGRIGSDALSDRLLARPALLAGAGSMPPPRR
jgi:sugar/nucleoside kinase (ribokinase family)